MYIFHFLRALMFIIIYNKQTNHSEVILLDLIALPIWPVGFCLPHQAFRCLVDRVGLGSLVPVEFFGSKSFEFLPDDKSVQRFEVCTHLIY